MNIFGRALRSRDRKPAKSVGPPGPYLGAPLIQVQSDGGPLWLRKDDGVILPYIERNGSWEPEEGALLRRLVRPGTTFVDVGANVGYFSRLIAAVCKPGRIYAFEPHPELVSVLRLNVWGLSPAVDVVPAALGESNGTVSLTSAEHNYGDTRVTTGSDLPTEMVAAMTRMDDVIHGDVDVVKIDVQGYESEVLRGMQRIIRENPQLVAIVEFWPAALDGRGIKPSSVLAQYSAMGFDVALLRNGSPHASSFQEILSFCRSAGLDGQANLVLRKR
ncbi:MAG: FkbM family methyltransferase [Phycicoccus sp.]|nr:FkbM family methyltransferase [Phycicoccus sp.]